MTHDRVRGGGRARRRPRTLAALAAGLLLAAASPATSAGAAGLAGPDGAGAPGLADLGPPPVAVLGRSSPAAAGGFGTGLEGAAGRVYGPDLALLGAAPGLEPTTLSGGDPAIHPAAVTLAPIVSGLPWRSGFSCTEPALEALRGGRKTDVQVQFLFHDTWDMMLTRIRDKYYRRTVVKSPQPVISMPMFPRTEFKQHAKCAAGDYDNFYRQIGAALIEIGAGNAILRLGWEPNVGSGSHPWGIDNVSEAPAYAACFRRQATVFRSVSSGFKFEWDNAKASSLPGNVLSTYPGDDVVDVIGLHYYAIDTQFSTQAKWNKFVNSTRLGGPQGIGSWIKYAASRGKPFAVPEWGVWAKNGTFAAADTPIYIQNMYNFFKANASKIGYENYSNCQEAHRIGPRTPFPKSSALYGQLWGAGK